jgi:hypothetical protein
MKTTLLLCLGTFLASPGLSAQALSVPTDVQLPGTQPLERTELEPVSKCDNCHAGYDPAVEPHFNWSGGPMAHAARDPLFWATVAVAEQDFAGAGDLCIRCHTPPGWLGGRSTPTDGSSLSSNDMDSVSCHACHSMTNPDDSEHQGIQNPPYVANDGGIPIVGWYGSGMVVSWAGSDRLGPYANVIASHSTMQSRFHRDARMCGTCHDVSNSVTGDLAPTNGAFTALATGTFSGSAGGPVTTKAAFNNPPFAYGIVERTFSEHQSGLLATTPVSQYASLPSELKAGAIQAARDAAVASGNGGDYVDGAVRTFTCQTCHMPPVTGKGANKSYAPTRSDLPHHDMTGGNYWLADAIEHLDGLGQLTFGGGLSPDQITALQAGAARARANLKQAASLTVAENRLTVTNLTGHKLLTGFPEGRRIWLDVKWRDAAGGLVREDGAYGPLSVLHRGAPLVVDTILDLEDEHLAIWEMHLGMSQGWATDLLGLGLDPSLPLVYDRTDGTTALTLGQLAASAPGSVEHTLHFVLNDAVTHDNRIPPYGMSYDAAVERNCRPEPATLFGAPGPGERYDHFDEVVLDPPVGATTATIDLLYQPTSWEFVQFLDLANSGAVALLATTGADLLSAWLGTGMAAPETMTTAAWTVPVGFMEYGTDAGGANIATLTSPSVPSIGTSARLDLDGFSGSGSAILLLTPTHAAWPLFGGTLLVDPSGFVMFLAPTISGGSGATPLAIPDSASLVGTMFFLQAGMPDATQPAGWALTHGLQMVIGA